MLSNELKKEIERQLSEKFSQAVTIHDTKPVGGGCINNAMKLATSQGTFFLKTNSAKAFPGMFKAESKGLKLLADANEIAIPSVVLQGEHHEFSFLLLQWIEPGPRKNNFFEDFGRKLAQLHRHTNTCFGLDHDNYIGSLPQSNRQTENGIDFFIEQRLMKQIELAEKNNAISNSTIQQFHNLFNKLPQMIPPGPPALLHGDLWGGNYMTDEHGAACLIDPAVYYGHREIDLAMTGLFGGFDAAFYDAYREEYPLEKGWQDRVDIFNLYPLLVHLNLFGGGYLGQVKHILSKY